MNEELQIASNVSLPVNYITKVVSVLAMRGAGKTYGVGVISEELLDYFQSLSNNNSNLVIIDPVGAHWGLRSHFPIHIIGGNHGDIQLDESSGRLFAEMIHQFKLNAVLDVSQMSQDEMVLFVADFLNEYYRLTNTPTHIVLEEADIFAPQRISSKNQKLSLAAVDTVVRRGRGKGMGVTMITQRPAVLNKNVLTQSDAAIIMNMTGETDLKVVGEYLNSAGATKKDISRYIEQIMKFHQGQALIFSTSWLKEIKVINFRKKISFHAGAEPELGQPNPADSIKLMDMNIQPIVAFLNGDTKKEVYTPNLEQRENVWSNNSIPYIKQNKSIEEIGTGQKILAGLILFPTILAIVYFLLI